MTTAAPSGPPHLSPAPAAQRWRPAHLVLAPYRLGFAAAMATLMLASLWWLAVQCAALAPVRTWHAALPTALAPTLAHAAVMVLGFFPLFFAGFIFTAVPRWLHVTRLTPRRLVRPVLAQLLGWLAWLAGALWSPTLALTGAACAAWGLGWVAWLLLRLVRKSHDDDCVHPRCIAAALAWGSACLAALALALALQQMAAARAAVLAGLWGCVAVVFVVAAHRLIAYFSADVLLRLARWGHFPILWAMLAALLGQAGFELLQLLQPTGMAWQWLLGTLACVQALVAAVLLRQAIGWWRLRRPRNRLMRLFFTGFVWLGLALSLQAFAHGWQLVRGGQPPWSGAALHALTMGCLATLMLAMVTRVSCGHSGRARLADAVVWPLFVLLQLATLARLAAGVSPPAAAPWLLAGAAALWALAMTAWGLRLGHWYGCPRPDGKPG